jgi:glycosyltransferase involved in cell wall biosynthesis
MPHLPHPHLSVVIPAFNNSDFIQATIRSILAQDYDDFELVIADHSSTDDTWRILEFFADDPRVTLLHTPAGGGAQRNWRRVTEAASGDYLRLVPGDDLLYPGTLTAQVQALDANPDAALAASKRDILDARGRVSIHGRGLQGLTGLVDGVTAVRRTIRLGTNVFGEPLCVTMRREALAAAGGWDGQFPYLIDQTSYTRVLLHGKLIAVPGVCGGFRVNAGQWSIALVDRQAEQAKAYHRWVREQIPSRISTADVWTGNRRAELMALARRAFYTLNRSRLRTPA